MGYCLRHGWLVAEATDMCEGCLSSWNKKESRDGAGETTVCSYCKALVEGIPSRAYTSEGRSSCCTREDSRREGSSRCAKKDCCSRCQVVCTSFTELWVTEHDAPRRKERRNYLGVSD
nr:uncharacterized protein LOC127349101 [Lolium perenne]